jgi:hypothetical protein
MAKQINMKAAIVALSDEEIAARLRAALQGVGMKATQLQKSLDKAHAARALELARELASAGELHSVGSGKAEWFFGADPIATLERIIPEVLRENGPLAEKDLAARVEARAAGHAGLVKGWLKGALARGVLFQHAPRAGSTAKLIGAELDPALLPPSDEALSTLVRSAVSGIGLNGKQLAATAGKAHGPRALELARHLAASGGLWRVVKGKEEWFFATDPITTLDRTVPALLREAGPLGEAGIKAQIKARAPGHDGLVKDWLKGALARGVIFEQPSGPGSKGGKCFGPELDLRVSLGKPLAELQKAISAVERSGVSRESVLEFLRRELGVVSAPPRRASREVFLEALRRFAADNPSGALLPVRELRARAGLGKQDFDAAALALSSEGLLELHHHDHAGALSEAEQSILVRDPRGRHYVGIALRGSA